MGMGECGPLGPLALSPWLISYKMKLCSAKYHFVGASHDKTLYPGKKSLRSIKTGEYKRQNSKITGISASKASDDFMIWPKSVQRMLHSAEKTIKSASSAISVTMNMRRKIHQSFMLYMRIFQKISMMIRHYFKFQFADLPYFL